MKIKLIKSIDKLLGTLLVRTLPPPAATPDFTPHSILFIRPGGIGDAVLLIPAINALKQKYPRASITVLAEKRNAAAFRLTPHVSRILLYDKPTELFGAIRSKYDVVIDTEQWHRLSAVVARLAGTRVSVGYCTNERKRLFTHTVSYFHDDYEAESFMHLLEPFGIRGAWDKVTPFLVVPEAAREKAMALLGKLAETPHIVIFPGASIHERRWGSDKFSEVAEQIYRKGIPIAVVGGKGDAAGGDRIVQGKYGLNLAAKTSLVETAAILERSSVLVSGDSGILHIGVGLGKPTVSLFGPGIAKKWAPKGERHVVINKNLPCSPCTRFGYTPKCSINAECMRNITVDEVLEAIKKQF